MKIFEKILLLIEYTLNNLEKNNKDTLENIKILEEKIKKR